MKKSNQKNQLLFEKTNIARLTRNNLHVIIGGNDYESEEGTKPNTDTISFTVITSSWKCIDLFGATTSS